MRRFLADASHELRTPIAGVQASAETMLRTDPGRAAREKLLLQILREAHRAGRLVDDLLTMTRLEQGIPLAMEQFDLVPLTVAAIELTRELAPGVDVQLHAPSHIQLHGDPQRITDTGPGVPPPDREQIFERFTRLAGTYPSSPDGNGLGLAIARSIASAHSGTLICADPAGDGSRFLLRLPRRG
jgi:signal transduction histidine kinase